MSIKTKPLFLQYLPFKHFCCCCFKVAIISGFSHNYYFKIVDVSLSYLGSSELLCVTLRVGTHNVTSIIPITL